jgi:hypothetical protein
MDDCYRPILLKNSFALFFDFVQMVLDTLTD